VHQQRLLPQRLHLLRHLLLGQLHLHRLQHLLLRLLQRVR
jgi:hypothetical protein